MTGSQASAVTQSAELPGPGPGPGSPVPGSSAPDASPSSANSLPNHWHSAAAVMAPADLQVSSFESVPLRAGRSRTSNSELRPGPGDRHAGRPVTASTVTARLRLPLPGPKHPSPGESVGPTRTQSYDGIFMTDSKSVLSREFKMF